MEARLPFIDWEQLKQHGVHPSFSLPSSYHAVRAHVSPTSIQEMCEKHPRDEYGNRCYREAVVIPLMLNQPPGTNMDNQVYRAHVERSRPRRGPADSKMYPEEDATKSTKDFGLEVTAKIGEQPKRLNLRQTWKDLVTVLKASETRPTDRPSAAAAENQATERGRLRSPVLPKVVPLSCTGAVEALLSAGAPQTRCSSAGADSWSTPVPQPHARTTVQLQAQDVESVGTTDCLEQAVYLPPRGSRARPKPAWRAPGGRQLMTRPATEGGKRLRF